MEEAALWLSRRDRGLTAAEQDHYIQWLQSDPQHAEALGRSAATLQRMMRLYEWQPVHTKEPNPDLLAPVTRRRLWWMPGGFAAAAALAVMFLWDVATPGGTPPEPAEKSYLRVNERVALPDGTRVELRDGSYIRVKYSDNERRVRLTSGEAHFTVWKDASRPFMVEVDDVTVVAVGTSFNVRRDEQAVEVLVTSGQVQLQGDDSVRSALPSPYVSSGERALISRAQAGSDGASMPVAIITQVSGEEIGQALAWQAPRLQFNETPLADAIIQFNRLNRHQLVLGDPSLEGLRIGGTFRPDNVDAFVRLLEITFKIRAEKRDHDETVLRRRL